MTAKRAVTPAGNGASVYGLENGRQHARRRAGRRRRKNTIVSGVVFVVVGGAVGVAGYYGWQFYVEEQERNKVVPDGVVDPRSADELILDFEDNPRLNGPGVPALGVGSDQP